MILSFSGKLFRGNRFCDKGKIITIEVDVPEPRDDIEKQLQEFIVQSVKAYGILRLAPFIFGNQGMIQTAKHYLFHLTASPKSFSCFAYEGIYIFCNRIGKAPDQLLSECIVREGEFNAKAIALIRQQIDEYIFYLKSRSLTSATIYGYINHINSFFRINGVNLNLNFRLRKKAPSNTRSIGIAQIQRVLEVSDIRERAIITILAVSGLRTGTLVQLRYKHVKKDLERSVFPVHLAIEAEITKGKYHGYSTFINREAADYLNAYLQTRRKGSAMVPPESITDESPLFRVWYHKGRVDPMSTKTIGSLIKNLYYKSGIITKQGGNRNELNPNSFRKFFRSQMSVLGLQRQYIEYMMGHKTDYYLDVKMAGIEYLRRVYRSSGISLYPIPEFDKIVLLKQAIQRLDFEPEEILKPEMLEKMGFV